MLLHLPKAPCSALLRFGSGGFGDFFIVWVRVFLVTFFSNPEHIGTLEMDLPLQKRSGSHQRLKYVVPKGDVCDEGGCADRPEVHGLAEGFKGRFRQEMSRCVCTAQEASIRDFV